MSFKTSNVETHLTAHDRNFSSVRSLIRDGALLVYLIVSFTAIPLLLSTGSRAVDLSLEGSIFWQLVTPSFLGVGIFLQLSTQTPFRRVIAMAAPLLPMLIWVALSVTWSEFPDYSIRRAVRLVMETTAVVLFAAAYRDQYKFLRVICFTFGLIVALDIALLGAPSLSFTPEGYTGVHYHKNNTGSFYLFAFPLFLLAALDRRIFSSQIISAALALCCLIFLGLSLSKTAQALTPVCLALTFVLISIGRLNTDRSVVILIVFCAIGLIAIYSILVGFDRFLSTIVEDLTFSGRDRIWDYTLSLFWKSPVIGHGYGSIWDVGAYSVLQQKALNVVFVGKHAHNGYIDILAGLGIVGLALGVAFLIVTFFRLWTRTRLTSVNRINFLAIYIFFAICLTNITESSFFYSNSVWVYFLLLTSATYFIAPPAYSTRLDKAVR